MKKTKPIEDLLRNHPLKALDLLGISYQEISDQAKHNYKVITNSYVWNKREKTVDNWDVITDIFL